MSACLLNQIIIKTYSYGKNFIGKVVLSGGNEKKNRFWNCVCVSHFQIQKYKIFLTWARKKCRMLKLWDEMCFAVQFFCSVIWHCVKSKLYLLYRANKGCWTKIIIECVVYSDFFFDLCARIERRDVNNNHCATRRATN